MTAGYKWTYRVLVHPTLIFTMKVSYIIVRKKWFLGLGFNRLYSFCRRNNPFHYAMPIIFVGKLICMLCIQVPTPLVKQIVCSSDYHFYNFTSTGNADPTISQAFLGQIQALCPLNAKPQTVLPLTCTVWQSSTWATSRTCWMGGACWSQIKEQRRSEKREPRGN